MIKKEDLKLFESSFIMGMISGMHKETLNILEKKNKKISEYIDEFLRVISNTIDGLEIFPWHIIWEYTGEKLPEYLSGEEKYLIREIFSKEDNNIPLERDNLYTFPEIQCLQLPLTKQEFTNKVINYFNSSKLERIFDLPLSEGYSYINIPIFPISIPGEEKPSPYWIITCIFRKEDNNLVDSEEFFKFMEFFNVQVGLAMDKFMECHSKQITFRIDKVGGEEKEGLPSYEESLKSISSLLTKEFQSDSCIFFLGDYQEDSLHTEFSTIDKLQPLNYSLANDTSIVVSGYRENKSLRTFRREKQWDIPGVGYGLCHPIGNGKEKVGSIVLSRFLSGEPRPLGNKQEYVKRPFSECETALLKRINRYVYGVILSYLTHQQRLTDIRNLIEQVTAPVKSMVGHLEDMLKGRVPKDRIREKLAYLNKLSKISLKYATNFEKTLEFDSQNIQLKKEKLYDLRDFLIGLSMEYQPLIRKKCISIRVTDETPNNINIYVDKDLFSRVLGNIMDNAVKYSFFPEEREQLGYQTKPFAKNAEENVLITALENNNSVIITIASLGLELQENEKNKIFNRGFRGIMAKERFNVGPGIGLYIAKKIIEAHRGKLELVPHKSKYNTIFRITLPKGEAEH